jgi:hypothetical protein
MSERWSGADHRFRPDMSNFSGQAARGHRPVTGRPSATADVPLTVEVAVSGPKPIQADVMFALGA